MFTSRAPLESVCPSVRRSCTQTKRYPSRDVPHSETRDQAAPQLTMESVTSSTIISPETLLRPEASVPREEVLWWTNPIPLFKDS